MKTLCKLAVGLLIFTRAVFADAPPALTVVTDRANAVYQRGETVTFLVSAPAGKKVQYKVTKDGFVDLKSGDVADGKVTASLDEPGVIRCEFMERR